nr:MAG TPA: Roseltide rT7, PLANT PROTEIN [Caudoviricetes sp.]
MATQNSCYRFLFKYIACSECCHTIISQRI